MRRILLALLSAALLWASFPPLGFAPAGWIALVPLLMALDGTDPRTGVRLGAVFGTAFFAASASWLWRIFGPACIGLWAYEGLFGALFGGLACGRRGRAWHLLGVPALWVGIEWLRAEANPLRFGWFVLGLSQSGSPRMMQVADLAGAYGLSFLMAAVSARLAFAARRGLGTGSRRVALASGLGLVAAVWAYGGWARDRWSLPGSVEATVVQAEDVQEDDLAKATRDLRNSPKLVVWPELAVAGDPGEAKSLRALAREKGTTLVVGCRREDGSSWRNTALVLGSDGSVLGEYVKHVPLPFFDDGIAGKGYPTFQTPAGRLGVCICYDMDFPWVMRGLTKAGAEVFAIPTLDLASWGEVQHLQHTMNARIRAVEHRRFIVRACSSGISQVIGPDGGVRVEVPGMAQGTASARVSPVTTLTWNDRIGWLLAPICMLFVVGAALWQVRQKRAGS